MGSLILPSDGLVYVDAQIFIYTVEKHPVYFSVLSTLWAAVASGAVEVASSELTLMETLVGAYRQGDDTLKADYELFFAYPGIHLIPITPSILRAAARLRGSTAPLRTPDALHAATAEAARASALLTNDKGFRRIVGLPLTILDDVLGKSLPE
ncbi:MAG: type II toxin-antitoxin system VapC family toxin [Isosphaeraceae bacterium]